MHRFYCANADFLKKYFTITDSDEIHHIKDVLRFKKGAVIQIFNSQNQAADVVIESFSQQGLNVSVLSVRQMSFSRPKITLACAPPKKDKFEWIIEKCTELGVDEIIPLKTKRGQVVFSTEKMASKLPRFEKVAVNAAKQSKRAAVPIIHPMTDLTGVLKSLDPQGLHLFPSLNGHPQHIKEVVRKASGHQSVTVFIGPEGDFTIDEVHRALDAGCVPVSLGNTVLKVETAAIAAVSFVRLMLGD
ncbi:MAG: 16S rRNA (uracil(1498)-N(3))-methyltransferase [Candidatus Omnitrophica bacterium]|nr:16S rRNA (uracil(1498)-N(3))-methyltransferase [Candidatus Omnitrophota bacterium]